MSNSPLVRRRRMVLTTLLLCMAGQVHASAPALTVAGGPYLKNVYTKLGSADLAIVLRYVSMEPEASLAAVAHGSAHFAVLDTALSGDEMKSRKLLQFPVMSTAVVPVFNLPGVRSHQLVLSGPVLADIMAGDITSWNAAAIRKLNPQLDLPALKIVRIVRKGKSGASTALANYLATVSPSFRQRAGAAPSTRWPGDVVEVADAETAVRAVDAMPGAISYAELDVGNQAGARLARLRQPGGTVVGTDYGYLAAAGFSLRDGYSQEKDNALVIMTREESWPIMLPVYAVIPAAGVAPDRAAALQSFFLNCFRNDWVVEQYGFVPLPPTLQARAISIFRRLSSS